VTLEKEVAGLSFIEKLNVLLEKGELDFWQDRIRFPNLSVDEFKQVIYRVDEVQFFAWVRRKSHLGIHGKNGEDYCFKFECEIKFGGVFEIKTKRYFIKGCFFEKKCLKGLTIQSFREV
jgi:hypothetical protein